MFDASVVLGAVRCCLCRSTTKLEPTDLPGSGFRCLDHDECRSRVRDIVSAHAGLADLLG